MILKQPFSFLLLLFLIACNKPEANDEKIENEEIGNPETTIEHKKSKGDTLELPAEELKMFLPSSFEDFVPTGQPVLDQKKEGDNSWSIVKQVYKNSQSEVTITIADYNRAYGLYAGATAIITPEYAVDTKEEKSGVHTLGGSHKALISYMKPAKASSLIMGVSDRFLITIEASNQANEESIQKIVDKINLSKLEEY